MSVFGRHPDGTYSMDSPSEYCTLTIGGGIPTRLPRANAYSFDGAVQRTVGQEFVDVFTLSSGIPEHTSHARTDCGVDGDVVDAVQHESHCCVISEINRVLVKYREQKSHQEAGPYSVLRARVIFIFCHHAVRERCRIRAPCGRSSRKIGLVCDFYWRTRARSSCQILP